MNTYFYDVVVTWPDGRRMVQTDVGPDPYTVAQPYRRNWGATVNVTGPAPSLGGNRVTLDFEAEYFVP